MSVSPVWGSRGPEEHVSHVCCGHCWLLREARAQGDTPPGPELAGAAGKARPSPRNPRAHSRLLAINDSSGNN